MMMAEDELLERRLEVARWLFALDDEGTLARVEVFVRGLRSENEVTISLSVEDERAIARGEADAAAGRAIGLEEWRARYSGYGI